METFGSTFGGHVFRSQKSQKSFLVCAPGGRLSATPPGEGGNLGGQGAKEGLEVELKENVPKPSGFSVKSGASDRFACTGAS